MEVLHFDGSDDTPAITLDKQNGIFEISGRSLPEDSAVFYEPVLKWLELYKKEPNATTDFAFKLDYCNTASSKFIQDILAALEPIKGIKILWYYQDDDEDMEATGREFSEQVEIPFEFKALPIVSTRLRLHQHRPDRAGRAGSGRRGDDRPVDLRLRVARRRCRTHE